MSEAHGNVDTVAVTGDTLRIECEGGRIARMRSKVNEGVSWPAAEVSVAFHVTDTMGALQAVFRRGEEEVTVGFNAKAKASFEAVAAELGSVTMSIEEAHTDQERRKFERTTLTKLGVRVSGGRISYGVEGGNLAGAQAVVDSAGNIQERFTATRLALMGPFALAFKKKKDKRELYLGVEGEDFAFVVPLKPDQGKEARQLAAQINSMAKEAARFLNGEAVADPAPAVPPAAAGSTVADELKKLAELRDANVLSDEEFLAEKAKLLGK